MCVLIDLYVNCVLTEVNSCITGTGNGLIAYVRAETLLIPCVIVMRERGVNRSFIYYPCISNDSTFKL